VEVSLDPQSGSVHYGYQLISRLTFEEGLEKTPDQQDGVERKAEAERLINESRELFAQRKSAEAIQLLRKAYELDKHNSLARSILANALVEHAYSIVETIGGKPRRWLTRRSP